MPERSHSSDASQSGDDTQTDDYGQLEQAIAALEAQRTTLGDAVVDTLIALACEKRAALCAPPQGDHRSMQGLRGERRLVTVMFADISGFTAMSEHMDPEAVRDRMNACFDRLVPIVERYGGTVDKFIGDEIMALFGAPTAHENDSERALHAALDMMSELLAFNAEYSTTLGLHFGINTGHVIAGGIGSKGRQEYSVMGDGVNLAARLEDASERGEILVGPDTYRLTAPLFDFDTLAPIQVKGKTDPVQVYRLLGVKAVRGRVRGIEGLTSPLVGRETELRALQAAVEQLCAGTGGIVTVVGEAGLGKSRLVAEIREVCKSANAQIADEQTVDSRSQTRDPQLCKASRVPRDATRNPKWVDGQCLSYGGSIAYSLWLDMLRGLLGVTQDAAPDVVRDQLQAQVQALCPDRADTVLPYLGRLMALPLADVEEDALRGLDGESLKAVTFRAIETLIECAARQQPLVIACDDLHWADPTSLELLDRLFALTDRVPLLLLCIFRPETEHGCWEIRQNAASSYRHCHTDLWLESLSSTESEALVDNLLHIQDLAPGLQQHILEHAEGNPLYVEEIIRSLIDTGGIMYDEAADHWQASQRIAAISIPDTLHGVLMARIDRLEETTRRVLQLASVIGRVFLYRVLADIAQEERELDTYLLTLQRQQMIREQARTPEPEYAFKHQLTQEVAYNGLLLKERCLYHQQVAKALEQLYPDRIEEHLGLLAHHWEWAGEAQQAMAYLRRAGEQAAAQYANLEAVDYFGRALWLVPEEDMTERYDILLAREKVYDLLGERRAQQEDLAALRATASALYDTRRQAQVALRQAQYAIATADTPTAIERVQEAVTLAQVSKTTDLEAEAHLQWGRALSQQVAYQEAHEQLEHARLLARDNQLPRVEADSLRALGGIAYYQGDYAAAKDAFEQSLQICRQIGDRRGEGQALNNLGLVSRRQGDRALARSYYEQSLRTYREIGYRQGEGGALINLGVAAAGQGDYPGARSYYEQALTIKQETGDRRAVGGALINLGSVCSAQGDYDQATVYLKWALTVKEETGDQRGVGTALNNLGTVSAHQGDYERAEILFRRALQIHEEIGYQQGQGRILSDLAFLLHRLGDDETAYGHAQRALSIAQDLGDRPDQGYALANLGDVLMGLERPAEAEEVYRQCLSLRRALNQPHLAIETLADLAEAVLAQGDLSQAQDHVQEILDYLETSTVEGAEDPFQVYLTCYRVLQASGDLSAQEILSTARRMLQERADKIEDEKLRRSYLENVAVHREIVEAWANANTV